jgi:hypothetical protein
VSPFSLCSIKISISSGLKCLCTGRKRGLGGGADGLPRRLGCDFLAGLKGIRGGRNFWIFRCVGRKLVTQNFKENQPRFCPIPVEEAANLTKNLAKNKFQKQVKVNKPSEKSL